MQHARSQLELSARAEWRTIALCAAFACGCATAVDVTDDELAAICAEPNTTCGSPTGSSGSGGLIGAGGSGGARGGSSNGGTFNSNGGRAGTSSSAGRSGTGGTG